MMVSNRFGIVSLKSILLITGAILAILVFVLAVYLPTDHSISAADEKIDELEQRILMQEKFYPVYTELEVLSEQVGQQLLPNGERDDSDLPRLNQLQTLLKEFTKRHELLVAAIEPVYRTIDKNEGRIEVLVDINGSIANFSRFVMEIIENVWFVEMKSIRVKSAVNSRQFRILVLLSFEPGDTKR